MTASKESRIRTVSASDLQFCPPEQRQRFEIYETMGMVKIEGKSGAQDARK
jgi:hypothetical protein